MRCFYSAADEEGDGSRLAAPEHFSRPAADYVGKAVSLEATMKAATRAELSAAPAI